MTKIALFFDSQVDRDWAYGEIKPLVQGDDHGVAGGVKDSDDVVAPWQLWATGEIDLKAVDALLAIVTCTRAADGKVDVTLEAAADKNGL